MRPDSFNATQRTKLKTADFSTYDPADEHSLVTVCVDRLQNGDVNVSFAVGDKFDSGEEAAPSPNASQNIAEAAQSLYSEDLPFLAERAADDARLCFVGDFTNENFAVVFVSPNKASAFGKDMVEFARGESVAGNGLAVDNFGHSGTSLVNAVRKVYQETVLSHSESDADYWVGRMEQLAGAMTVVEQADSLDGHSAHSALKDHRSAPERLLRFDTYAADVVLRDGADPKVVRSLSNVGLADIETNNKVMREVARTVADTVSGYVTVVAVVDNLTGRTATVVAEIGKNGGLFAAMAHATAYVTDWATLTTRQRGALGYSFEKDFDDHKFSAETLKLSAPVGRGTKEDDDDVA